MRYPTLIDPNNVHNREEVYNPKLNKMTYNQYIDFCREKLVSKLHPLYERINVHNEKQLNNYYLKQKIGFGQFSSVYLGEINGKFVAMKCINKRPSNSPFSMACIMKKMKSWGLSSDEVIMELHVNRVRWESFILSYLDHPNVINLFKCMDSPSSSQIWIITSWASLGELQWERSNKHQCHDQWIAFSGREVTVQEFALRVLRDICRGLKYLQTQGVIHRDIKPSNVLLDLETQTMRISDFGCSLIIPSKLSLGQNYNIEDSVFKDELHKVQGTPAFIPPEICNFQGQKTLINAFKIDIWSLGVTMFCILENELPFIGENEFDTYNMIINERKKSDGNWLNNLVVAKLLCKDAEKRISSSDILKLLEQYTIKQTPSNKFKLRLNNWKLNLSRIYKNKNDYQKTTTLSKLDYSSSSSLSLSIGSSLKEFQLPVLVTNETPQSHSITTKTKLPTYKATTNIQGFLK